MVCLARRQRRIINKLSIGTPHNQGLERATGFEPVPEAWKALMLPLTPSPHRRLCFKTITFQEWWRGRESNPYRRSRATGLQPGGGPASSFLSIGATIGNRTRTPTLARSKASTTSWSQWCPPDPYGSRRPFTPFGRYAGKAYASGGIGLSLFSWRSIALLALQED